MTSEPAVSDVRIAGRPIVITPHNCFACGSLNAHGLHLALHASDDRCWLETTLEARFQGWDGIAHGGIITTILDEVMAWALVEHDLWGVTARLQVDFLKPVPVGLPIRAEGRVIEVRRRLVDAEGVITNMDGAVLARSRATFVGASEEKKRELKARYGYGLGDQDFAMPDQVDAR